MRYIFQTFSTYSSLCSPVYLIAVLFSRDLKTMWSMWVSLCSKNNSEQCFRLEVWTFRMNGTRRNAKREIIFNRKCDTNDRVVVCPRLNSGFDLLGYVWRLTEIRWKKKKCLPGQTFLEIFWYLIPEFLKENPESSVERLLYTVLTPPHRVLSRTDKLSSTWTSKIRRKINKTRDSHVKTNKLCVRSTKV